MQFDYDSWLAALHSAESNQNWEEVKTLAERRLAVAPADRNAIFALKDANKALNPDLDFVFSDDKFDFGDLEYIRIEPQPEPIQPRITGNGCIALVVGVFVFCIVTLAGISHLSINRLNSVVATRAIQATRTSMQQLEGVRESVTSGTVIGIGGFSERGCGVAENRRRISGADVVRTPWVYVASPLPAFHDRQKLRFRWIAPDGSGLEVKSLKHSDTCIQQAVRMKVDGQFGSHTLNVYYGQRLVHSESLLKARFVENSD